MIVNQQIHARIYSYIEEYQQTKQWAPLDTVGSLVMHYFQNKLFIHEEDLKELRELEVVIIKCNPLSWVINYIHDIYTSQYIRNYQNDKEETVLDGLEKALQARYHFLSAPADNNQLQSLKNELIKAGLSPNAKIIKSIGRLCNLQQIPLFKLPLELIRAIANFLPNAERDALASVNKFMRQALHYPAIPKIERTKWSTNTILNYDITIRKGVRALHFSKHNFTIHPIPLNTFPNVELLELDTCEGVSDSFLKESNLILKSVKQLRFVDCDITDEGLEMLGLHCKKVREIQLPKCFSITSKGLMALSPILNKVVKLCLPSSIRITQDPDCLLHVDKLTENFKDLEEFESCEMYDADATALLPALKNLKKLSLPSLEITLNEMTDQLNLPEFFLTLKDSCANLEELDLSEFWQEDFDYQLIDPYIDQLIPHLKAVKRLNLLCSIIELNENRIRLFRENCRHLEEVNFSGSLLNDKELILLAPCLKNVRKFIREMGLFEDPNNSQLTSQGMAALTQHCQQLEEISFAFSKTQDGKCLIALAPALQIVKVLNLEGFSPIDDACFPVLAQQCKKLQTLNLDTSVLKDANIVALAPALRDVISLDLGGRLTGNCFPFLARYCKKLKKFNISSCERLEERYLNELTPLLGRLSTLKLPWHISSEIVLKILLACPNLEHFQQYSIDDNRVISCSSRAKVEACIQQLQTEQKTEDRPSKKPKLNPII